MITILNTRSGKEHVIIRVIHTIDISTPHGAVEFFLGEGYGDHHIAMGNGLAMFGIDSANNRQDLQKRYIDLMDLLRNASKTAVIENIVNTLDCKELKEFWADFVSFKPTEGKIQKECLACGAVFEVNPSGINASLCSWRCNGHFRKRKKNQNTKYTKNDLKKKVKSA